ncbi:MAG: M36 family metallopeptidase, partial [Ferruginibacter sp.]
MRKIIPLILLMAFSVFFTKAQNVSQAENDLALRLASQLVSSNDATGITAEVFSNSRVFYTYEDVSTGIRYVSLQQTYKGIPVYNQILALSFRNGKLLTNFGALDPNIDNAINSTSARPAVSAESAVQSALSDRGFRASQMAIAINRKDDGKFVEFGNMGVSRENITAQLTWVPNEQTKTYNLAWQVYIIPKTNSDYWMVRVDAVNNSILGMDNYTVYDNWGIPNENPNIKYPGFDYGNLPVNNSETTLKNTFDFKKVKTDDPSLVTTATYRVVPYPAESPLHPGGAPALRTDPWTNAGVVANAVTLRWHTGAAAADYDYSRSNNVWAYEDRTAPTNTGSIAKSASSQTAFPNLTFDFVPDFTQEPIVNTVPIPNQRWNITNLFYWNNIAHDILYGYGFTEAGRNFQDDNLGRGGAGNDHVNAEAQDASNVNNANFSTPADGGSGRMQMFLWNAPTPDRDGDVDNGIILHELGHGVSNRSNQGGVGCLGNQEQAGEGWSDYLGLMMTQNWATATLNTGFNSPRGIGTYALNQPNSGPGIRPQRYCTDMSINTVTYANLPGQAVPHGVGFVFCSALWELTWELINDPSTTGIDPNIYNFAGTGGNVVALRLVMEGLRVQPCQPGFITARDAILAADVSLYGGSHTCAIWRAFARRGMGFGAAQGSSASINDQTVSFAMPPTCVVGSNPTVTINQAAAQPDPTSVAPINFTVVFDQVVTGFATGDVTLSGTAGATLATVTGSGTTYNVAVTGMTTTGTVLASIAPGVCINALNEPNLASTSTDNTVTFTVGVCTTFVGTVGPANSPVSLRANRDGVISTCAAATCPAPAGIAGALHYVQHTWTNPVNAVQCVNVSYTNTATNFSFVTAHNGSVVLTNFCTNWLGHPGSSAAAGATINWSFNVPPLATVVFHVGNVTPGQTASYSLLVTAPICVAAAPSVTINQAAAQPDPTGVSPINFTAVFSEAVTGFATGDVTVGGTAGATTATVTGGPTTYNVAVSGMTGSGTVTASIAAGVCVNGSAVPNTASTSTDNSVTYNVPLVPCVATFSYTGPAVAVPDNTPAGVNIPLTVSGAGTITDLNFRFDAAPASTCDATPGNVNAAMDHTFIGDLIFTLTSPGGTTVTIVNQRGGTRENICTTLLDDDGAFPSLGTVTSASGQFLSGNFAPDNPLSAFDGQNANGVWTLNVSDNAIIDNGSMRRFSLIITSANPTVNTVPNQSVCAGSPTTAVNFTGTPAGATYNWTNSAPAIGLAASGTGNIASFIATNATAAPIVATITVTPVIGGCLGTPTSFTITVNPTPIVNAIPNQVLCQGSPTTAVTFTGTPAGTIFQWTNNTPAIGLAAAGTGNIPSFIALNPGSTPLVATITVTPVTGLATPVVTTFNATGAVQTFTVPAGINSVNLKTWGAQGNSSVAGGAGGLGGYAEGNLAVVPGQVLNVYVGGGATSSLTGGFNGGGAAGANPGCANARGGGGGGASDVRIAPYALANRVIVGAGGGGAGGDRVAGCGRGTGGGGGGGLYGGGGGSAWIGSVAGWTLATGGTQAAGGAGGTSTFATVPGNNGAPGTLGIGGAGGVETNSNQAGNATGPAGGVGGGSTGGGGNHPGLTNFVGASGAGGSSYIGGVTGGITTAGLRTGAGQVQITYTPVSAATCFGTQRTFTITVNPNASLVIVADPGTTLCEGDPTLLTVYDAAGTGPVSLTQSGSQVPVAGSVSCNAGGLHTDNSYWRAYNLATLGLPSALTVNTVTFGIEQASGGAQPVTVRLYTQNAGPAFPGGTRT